MKLLQKIAIHILTVLAYSWRFKLIGEIPNQNSVIAFWHGSMLPGWFIHKHISCFAIVSLSKDGSVLTNILNHWGIDVIRGSSSNNGKEALQSAVDELQKGRTFLITPDGPKGPRNNMKPGAVIAAFRASKPLFLCRIDCSSAYRFKKSWDLFSLPLPFASINVHYTKIYPIQDQSNREEIQDIIHSCENILNGESLHV